MRECVIRQLNTVTDELYEEAMQAAREADLEAAASVGHHQRALCCYLLRLTHADACTTEENWYCSGCAPRVTYLDQRPYQH